MTCAHFTERLHDYVDGELAADETRQLEAHLAHCARCQQELGALRRLVTGAAALPREISPGRDLWNEIKREIERPNAPSRPRSSRPPRRQESGRPLSHAAIPFGWLAPLAIAASIVFLSSFAERGLQLRGGERAWSVANVAGAPRVDQKTFRHEARFRVGQWLETDSASRARVVVGEMGEVNVDPNSRLRLVGMAANDHRLELERGSLSAMISAPPRLFYVDTPSATAVDLGCAYTLAVDDEGNGELHVSIGYVALEHGQRESIIRMGMKCLTRRGAGPGTPFADDASDDFRAALARFDFEPDAAPAGLADILAHARTEDAITLWHLLSRTEGDDRAAVFQTLAKVSPPPPGITREGILAGDTTMRHAWGNVLGLGILATP